MACWDVIERVGVGCGSKSRGCDNPSLAVFPALKEHMIGQVCSGQLSDKRFLRLEPDLPLTFSSLTCRLGTGGESRLSLFEPTIFLLQQLLRP
jgi:hypothetical protein